MTFGEATGVGHRDPGIVDPPLTELAGMPHERGEADHHDTHATRTQPPVGRLTRCRLGSTHGARRLAHGRFAQASDANPNVVAVPRARLVTLARPNVPRLQRTCRIRWSHRRA